MPSLPCPGCSSQRLTSSSYRYSDPDGHFAEPLTLVECGDCHLVFLKDEVKDDSLYYSAYYGKGRGLPSLIFEPFNQYWVRRKADKIARLLPGQCVLDFGCGRGDVLIALSKRGYEAWGLETQPEAAAALEVVLGPHVIRGLEQLAGKKDLFDGITLWHVLEHLEHPQDTLRQLAFLAKPGAVLFVAVPNWDSLERRIFGDRWFHSDVPRHVLQFSPVSLTSLLSRTGWKTKSVRFDGWAYNIFGLFQSLLNIGPGPRNLFYRLGKRGAFPPGSPAYLFIGVVWNVIAIVPAAVLAIVLTPAVILLHKSGTFEVISVKN